MVSSHFSTMRTFIAWLLGALGFVLLASLRAPAAEVPGTVLPGQIEQQFKQEPKIRAGQPDRGIAPEPQQQAPPEAAGIRFTLTKIVVENATVYSESALLSAYKDLLGNEVLLSDIYAIASSLTARYRNDGYILSRVIVPVQTIERGEVRLTAIEGYVARVAFEGVDSDKRRLVERYAEAIAKSRPLRNDVLERSLLLMNDLPGAFARATIRPSEGEPGASELTVHFSQRQVQGGLWADNRGGESLGPLRISIDAAFNSVLGLQESTVVRLAGSNNDRMRFASLVHEEKTGSGGGNVNLSASWARGDPKETAFIPLELETSSQTYALGYIHPVIRSRSENLSLRAGFYAHDGKTELFGMDDTHDRIRAFRIGATYDTADSWQGINILDVELSQGINGLGASDNNDAMLSRPTGRVDFTKVVFYAARLQQVAPKWSVLAAATGQYAWTDLLSSELFGFGGEQFGRGYDPSELVGDNGLAGKLEVRFTDTLPRVPASSYTAYGFFDAGMVSWRKSDGNGQSDAAASTGLGLRVNLGPSVSCFVELAKLLTRDLPGEGDRNGIVYAGAAVRF
jgi:hemolysin activation/secretion protein